MAKKLINVGITANDSTGDPLRSAGQIINDNFTELYNALGGSTGAPLSIVSKVIAGDGIIVSSTTGDVLITSKTASEIDLGSIRIGPGINIDEEGIASVNLYELPKASSTILGGIKVGDRLTINAQGVLSADPGAYTLPKATGSVLGGIKIGTGLEIDGGGIVSISNANKLINGLNEIVLGADGGLSFPDAGGANPTTEIYTTNGGSQYTFESYYVGGRGSGTYLQLDADNGAVIIRPQSGVNVPQWTFDAFSKALNSPGGSFTKTTNNYLATNVATQVVWTSTRTDISGVKLTIQVECDETGTANWHTQVCEAIIAVRGYNSLSEPVMSVYGVTHTSVAPLMTFSVQRSPTTFLIEIVGTRTATARLNDGADLRIYSVETGTND